MLINEARSTKRVTKKLLTVQCTTVHLFALYSIVETLTDSFVMYIELQYFSVLQTLGLYPLETVLDGCLYTCSSLLHKHIVNWIHQAIKLFKRLAASSLEIGPNQGK